MNTKHLMLLAALGGTAAIALAPSTASAGEVEAAEHSRLYQEMKKRAGQNAWSGVERSFLELVELQKKGEVLTYAEWYLGAQAARGLGNIANSRERLVKALEIEETEEARNWLKDIDANYGAVSIKGVSKKDVANELTIKGMPFAPDQRAAVEAAQATVVADRAFDGLLPKGSYIFAAGECGEAFEVVPGAALVEVKCGAGGGPKEPVEKGLAFVGPRADIGGGFTLGSAALDGTYGANGEWAPDDSFSGVGPRVALGLEAGLGSGLTFGAQLGYHGLFSGGGETPAGVSLPGDRLNLFFGQAGAGYRLGKLWFSGAGVYGMALGATTTGVSAGQFENMCEAQNSGELNCAALAQDEELLAATQWSGSGTMAGVNASASVALFDLSDGLKGAVTVSGGSMFSSYRNYPWGMVAFTVAPQASRRD